ncbi:MAG: hypothetical protein ABSB41_01960 [Anaerolineales bacterium]|jgi:hypothetical protein
MTNKLDSDDELLNEEETNALIYAFAAAPGFQIGRAGRAFASHKGGLKRTEDGGQSWQDALADFALSEQLPVTSLVISPVFDHDGLVFAGAPGGILRSSLGGKSWKAVLFPPPSPLVSALAISPNFASDETVFAGTMEDGVFISKDAGEKWASWNFGLLDLNVLALAISPNYIFDETLFAGTETGLFRSTNGGRAWREVELPFGFDAVISLAISPNYTEDHCIYIGSEDLGLWESADEGEHWIQLAKNQLSDPVNAILVSRNELLAVNAVGLWHSADGGTSWINCLPKEYTGFEISAVLAPQGIGFGATLLAGFTNGSIKPVMIAGKKVYRQTIKKRD